MRDSRIFKDILKKLEDFQVYQRCFWETLGFWRISWAKLLLRRSWTLNGIFSRSNKCLLKHTQPRKISQKNPDLLRGILEKIQLLKNFFWVSSEVQEFSLGSFLRWVWKIRQISSILRETSGFFVFGASLINSWIFRTISLGGL